MPVGDGKALEEVWILFLIDYTPLVNRVRRSFFKLRITFFRFNLPSECEARKKTGCRNLQYKVSKMLLLSIGN